MEYGTKGFEERTIRRMMKFAQIFPDIKIVTPLVSKSLIQDLRQIINSLRFSLTFKLSHHWCEN